MAVENKTGGLPPLAALGAVAGVAAAVTETLSGVPAEAVAALGCFYLTAGFGAGIFVQGVIEAVGDVIEGSSRARS